LDTSGYPTLDSYVGGSSLPAIFQGIGTPQPVQPTGFFHGLGTGLKSGVLGLGADLGGLAGAVGTVTGAQPLVDFGNLIATNYKGLQDQNGASAIEQAPWFSSPGTFAAKAGYTLGNIIPQAVGVVGAAGLAAPEAVAGAAARTLPTLGEVAAGGAAAYPAAVNSVYNSYQQQPGGATRADATFALAAGVPLGALQALAPEQAFGKLAAPVEGSLAAKIGKGALEAGGLNAVAGGAQALADTAFRSDMTTVDKAKNIVQSAVESGAVGGVLGGAFGARTPKVKIDTNTPNADIAQGIDSVLGKPIPDPNAPQPEPASAAPPEVNPFIKVPPPIPGGNRNNAVDVVRPNADGDIPGNGFTLQGPRDLSGAFPSPALPPTPGEVTIRDAENPLPPMANLFAKAGIEPKTATMRAFLDDPNHPADLPGLFNTILDVYDNNPKIAQQTSFKEMAQKIGLLDSDGKVLDIKAALNEAIKNKQPAAIARLAYLDQVWDAAQAQRVGPVPPAPEPPVAGALPAPLLALTTDKVAGPGFVTDKASVSPPVSRPVRNVDLSNIEDNPGYRQLAQEPVGQLLIAAHDIQGDAPGPVTYAELKDALRVGKKDSPWSAPDFAAAVKQLYADEDSTHTPIVEPAGGRGMIKIGKDFTSGFNFDPEAYNRAIQERSAASVDVRQSSEDGGGVGAGNPEGAVAAPRTRDDQIAEANPTVQGTGTADLRQEVRQPQELVPDPAQLAAEKAAPPPIETLRPEDMVAPPPRLQADNYPGEENLISAEQRSGARRDIADSLIDNDNGGTGANLKDVRADLESAGYKWPQVANELAQMQADGLVSLHSMDDPREYSKPQNQAAKVTLGGVDRHIAVLRQDPDAVLPIKRMYDARQSGGIETPDVIAQHYNQLASRLRPEYRDKTHLIPDAGGLPEPILRALVSNNIDPKTIPAMHYRGNTYIQLSEMRNRADLEQLFAHEHQHMANAEIAGGNAGTPQHTQMMADLFDRAGGREGIEKTARQFKVWEPYGEHAGLASYFPAAGFEMTPEDKARIAEELTAHAAEPERMGAGKRAILGWMGKLKFAIASRLRDFGFNNFAKKFESFKAADVQHWLNESRGILETPPREEPIPVPEDGGSQMLASRRIANQNDTYQRFSRQVGSILELAEHIPYRNIANKVAAAFDSLKSLDGIARGYADTLPRVADYAKSEETRSTLTQQHQGIGAEPITRFSALYDANPKLGAEVLKAIQEARVYNLDFRRQLSENKWLFANGSVPVPELAAKHAELRQVWLQKATPEMRAALTDYWHSTNGEYYAAMATQAHDVLSTLYPEMQVYAQNPNYEYQFRDDVRDPVSYSNFWGEKVDQLTMLQAKIDDAIAAATPGGKAEVAKVRSDYAPLISMLNNFKMRIEQAGQAPYSYLGRQGDHGVSFHLKPGPGGIGVDPKAIARAQQLFEKDFPDVSLDAMNPNGKVFSRFKTLDDSAGFFDLALQLKKEGLLDPDNPEITKGQIGADATFDQLAPEFVQQMLQKVDESPELHAEAGASAEKIEAMDKAREALKSSLRRAAIDLLPNHGMTRLMLQSKDVQGYSRNALANMAEHNAVAANAISMLATKQDRHAAVAGIRKDMETATKNDTLSPMAAERVQQTGREVLLRSSFRYPKVARDAFDALSAITHQAFISFNPAYLPLNVSQNIMFSMPEQFKKFPVRAVYAANARAYGAAFKIMREVYRGNKLGDFHITPGMLQRAGLGEDIAKQFMHVVNSGAVGLSGFSQAMSHIQQGGLTGKYSKFLHMSNSFAIYSETLPRIVAALSSLRLSGGDTAYAKHVVNDSLLNYGTWNSPRSFGKNSPLLGRAGPLVMQFHRFQGGMIEKIGHEMVQAFKDVPHTFSDGKITLSDAQKFVLGHLAAATVLGGSLGLPAAGWTVAAGTKLSSVFNGGESWDIENSYRNFLAQMTTPEIGELIAHGLPSYLGLDFSRMSDADLLPGREFLADRRRLEDALPAAIAHSTGAVESLGANMFLGLRDVANGRVLQGMQKFMPTTIRHLVGAYKLTTEGYTNANREPIPLTANAQSILATALGFTPSRLSEYNEAHMSVAGAQEEAREHAKRLKEDFAAALDSGNRDRIQSQLARITAFDQDPAHINQMVSPGLGSYIANRQSAISMAKATGRPLGVSAANIPAIKLTDYLRQ